MTQQKSTEINKINAVNNANGLTPQQERAASLLVAGKNYTEIAKELEIDRSTLYLWSEKVTFQTYFNMLCREIQDEVKNGLIAMYNDAVGAIRGSLTHDNHMLRFKAATWLLEKLESQNIGATNPREVFRKMATHSVWPQIMEEKLDDNTYKRLCKENGVEP